VALAFDTAATVGQTVPYVIVGIVLLSLLPYLLTLLAGGHAAVARALLLGGSTAQLRAELVELSHSRVRLADAFAAERQRIERDLHDGAQQKLVSLTLHLGLARFDLGTDSPAAGSLATAHEQAKQLMAQLRQLIHGIQPQVLTDLGLAAALDELAHQSPIPVTVEADLPGRRYRPNRAGRPGGRRRRPDPVVQPDRRPDPPPRGTPVQPAAIRVVIAEDEALLREGLAGLLDRFGLHTVATVGDAQALTTAVAEHRPDLVVTDIRMPPTYTDEGLRAAVDLRRAHPGLAVVTLSQYLQHGYAADLLDSGDGRGVGYLLKDRVVDIEDFIVALRRVAAGGTVIDPHVISQLIRHRRDPLSALSVREREVLTLIAQRLPNTAIARQLFISEPAVGKHVGNIFAKLHLPQTDDTNRRVLAVLAHLRAGPPR
jgi:DNA-binding NarL/FixJ family response regulator